MAYLNMKFYDSNDNYSDGNVENTIIKLLNKYNDNIEFAFKDNSSWTILYHLSDIRKNVIRWYPIKSDSSILEIGAGMGALTEELVKKCKKVTSIELSKRRADSILMRNKKAKNLEIIVGNFNKIKLNEKYDYVLLNGVLEYAKLYTNTDNPYVDFINKIKKHLKKDGKILIAIENRLGLKYICGAKEDHTNISFNGINEYNDNSDLVRTFDKNELEDVARNCNMYANFYYMFPDYKFPKVIYTDEAIEKGVFSDYSPYYSSNMDLVVSEHKMYMSCYRNKVIPVFANSFFVELSFNIQNKEVLFAKFNNDYRDDKFSLMTIMKGNNFYKIPIKDVSFNHIQNIINIDKILSKNQIDKIEVFQAEKCIYSKYVKGQNLQDIIQHLVINHNYEEVVKIFDRLFNIVKKTSGKKIVNPNQNIFNDYNIEYFDVDISKYDYYEYCLIDVIPSNVIVNDNKYYLIDQEWILRNIPVEYSMYRMVKSLCSIINIPLDLKNELINRFNINEPLFDKIEKIFINQIISENFKYYYTYFNNYRLINIESIRDYESQINELNSEILFKNNEIKKINNINSKLKLENNELVSLNTKIISSKWWKLRKIMFWKR